MLGDVGSIASMVGVVVSLVGLGFAIRQIRKLRGGTRAAREASEATRRAIGRELASTELIRLGERIDALKELHRSRDCGRCLTSYSEIRDLLLEIRRRHPGLSDRERANVLRATVQISEMDTSLEALEGEITSEIDSDFNAKLTDFRTGLLPRLEDQLQGHT